MSLVNFYQASQSTKESAAAFRTETVPSSTTTVIIVRIDDVIAIIQRV